MATFAPHRVGFIKGQTTGAMAKRDLRARHDAGDQDGRLLDMLSQLTDLSS